MLARLKSTGEIIRVKELKYADGGYMFHDETAKKLHSPLALDFNVDGLPEEIILDGYVARDRNNNLGFHRSYPEWFPDLGYWYDGGVQMDLPEELFPFLTSVTGPREATITVKLK